MFDVGFQELLLIGVVALIVVGPERLPILARKVGMWLGRGRRMLSNLKQDIDAELKATELQKVLDTQALSDSANEIIEKGQNELNQVKNEFESSVNAQPELETSTTSHPK